MLAVSTYSTEHVDRARRRIAADTEAFAAVDASPEAEAAFFNNMVLALDHYFLHRVRKAEGKDGNPLNEVRVLCDSLTEHGGVLTPDKTIKLKTEDSVLGLEPGDEVRVTGDGFRRLAEGFFRELEARYS